LEIKGANVAYPSDLKDKEWIEIQHFFKNGNRSLHSKRTLMNAVLYVVKTGCQWRWLPQDFPSWKTVHTFYSRMCKDGTWEKMMQHLVIKSRIKSGRNENPTLGIIDSQSVKTTNAAISRGIDGGKKNQRKETTYCY
jgi:putative transposase